MPYLPLAGRYAGYSQIPFAVSPGLLSPDAGDPNSPAFDPSMAALDQNQAIPPIPPPPPQQPPQQGLSDTAVRAQIANPPPLIPLNGQPPAGGSARDTGVKQLLAANGRPAMPPPTPPGAQASAAPAADPGALPLGAPATGAGKFRQYIVDPDAGGGTDVNAATPAAESGTFYPQALRGGAPTAGTPSTAIEPSATDKEIAEIAQQSKDLKEPELKTNWLQRLSSALLALTRFAPYSNQIVHPKYTALREQYETQQEDLAQRAKLLESEEATEAQAESRRAWAAQRYGNELVNTQKAADLASKPAQLAAANQEKLDKDAADFYEKHTGQIEKFGGQILPPGTQAPNGWAQIPIVNPTTKQPEIWTQPPLLDSVRNQDPALADELVRRNIMTQDQTGQSVTRETLKTYRDQIEKIREAEAANASKIPPTPSPEEQSIEEFRNDPHNANPDGSKPSVTQARAAIARAIKPPEEAGSWTPAEDSAGNPILYNAKTGETKAAGNIRKAGTKAAEDKLLAGPQDAVNYAQSYLGNGVFTGPGDEALQEKFFELAKPSTGFRMTQPQIDQLKNSQSWMNSLEAKAYHAATGRWFSDQQRKEIVGTMNDLARAKGVASNPSGYVKTGTLNGQRIGAKADGTIWNLATGQQVKQ